MINISGLRKSFGTRVLLRDVSLRVGARDRVAIVGPNGAGKTTLLEMIMGIQAPDAGRIDILSDANIGYLPQETDAMRGKSILAEVMSAGQAMTQAGHRLEVLEHELEQTIDPDERERLLHEFAALQGRFDDLGGYSLESDARRILSGLGFDDVDRLTDALSGGWMMRVALAKLLLAAPDILLLDEPTNHLDLESVRWLEQFLRAYDGAVLVISHDRDFMNAIVNTVVEIDSADLISYKGDYGDFVEQREQRILQLEALARNQQRAVAHTEKFIERFRYKASKARQVQSRVKQLEKLDRVEAPSASRKVMKIGFPRPPRSARAVVELTDLVFGYSETPVYDGLTLAIERGEKVALVGPNGAGKTTLLKLLAGELSPTAGTRKLGENVSLGYFAQHQVEALDPNNRVVEELGRAIPPGANVRPRDILGSFLFSGDDADKPVRVLSGGERTRLALAKLLCEPHNFLCLDEPTNHLDIASRDVLEDALLDYEGSMVLIAHDRHLIRSVANMVFEVNEGRVRRFVGDYESYLFKIEQEALAAEQSAEVVKVVKEKSNLSPAERRRASAAERTQRSERRKRLRQVEVELEAATARHAELSAILADPDFYTRTEDVSATVKEFESVGTQIKSLEAEWDTLTESAEAQ